MSIICLASRKAFSINSYKMRGFFEAVLPKANGLNLNAALSSTFSPSSVCSFPLISLRIYHLLQYFSQEFTSSDYKL